MTKKQILNFIDEQDLASKNLLQDLVVNFKDITGYLWDFSKYVELVESEAKKQLKIGNEQLCTELHLFLDSIIVNN